MATNIIQPTEASGTARFWKSIQASWPVWLTAAAFLPLLLLHGVEVRARPHYEFVPMLLPGAGLLLWSRCRNLGDLEPGHRVVAVTQGVLVWLLLAMAIVFVSSWLGAVAALLAIPAIAYAIGGRRLVGAIAPAAVLLALAIPPPFQLDYALVGRLQALVSRCSGMLLDLLRIDHVMEGNVIDLGTRQLLVDQACSGIYSLFTLGAFTLFYVLWTRASWTRSAILIASAIFWVVMGNVLRVTAIAVLASRYGIDATAGKKHTALGLVGFMLMLAMVVCTDRLLAFARSVGRVVRHHGWGTRRQVARSGWAGLLLNWDEVVEHREAERVKRGQRWRQRLSRSSSASNPTDGSSEESADTSPARRPARGPTRLPDLRRTWPGALMGGLAFALLLIPQTRLPALSWDTILADRVVEERAFARLDAASMPAEVAGLGRSGFKTETRDHDLTWGENSRTWSYLGPAGMAVVSLDYPFVGWHDLTDCYVGRGFHVVSRRVVPENQGGPALMAELSRRDGRHVRVLFGLFDREGTPLTPPDGRDLVDMAIKRLSSWRLTQAPSIESSKPTHQIQVIQTSGTPLEEGQGVDLLALYRAAVSAAHKTPLTQEPGSEPRR